MYHSGFNQGRMTSQRFMCKTDTQTPHTHRCIYIMHTRIYLFIPTHIYIQVPHTHTYVGLTQGLALHSCRGWLSSLVSVGQAIRKRRSGWNLSGTIAAVTHSQGSFVPPPPHMLLLWESLSSLRRALDWLSQGHPGQSHQLKSTNQGF